MTVNELIKILNKVENKDLEVSISIDYDFGEMVRCSEVNCEELEDGVLLFGDEE